MTDWSRRSNTIKVVCRFRPQNRLELENGARPIVSFETEDTCNLDVSVTDASLVYRALTTNSRKRPLGPSRSIGCLT